VKYSTNLLTLRVGVAELPVNYYFVTLF